MECFNCNNKPCTCAVKDEQYKLAAEAISNAEIIDPPSIAVISDNTGELIEIELHEGKWELYRSLFVLGYFKYHTHEVMLVGNAKETEYKVIVNVSFLNQPLKSIPACEITSECFDDLSPARATFEAKVLDIISRTSFTDVSIYEQQS